MSMVRFSLSTWNSTSSTNPRKVLNSAWMYPSSAPTMVARFIWWMICSTQWSASAGETLKANGAIQWSSLELVLETQFGDGGHSAILPLPIPRAACPEDIHPVNMERKATIDKRKFLYPAIDLPRFSFEEYLSTIVVFIPVIFRKPFHPFREQHGMPDSEPPMGKGELSHHLAALSCGASPVAGIPATTAPFRKWKVPLGNPSKQTRGIQSVSKKPKPGNWTTSLASCCAPMDN